MASVTMSIEEYERIMALLGERMALDPIGGTIDLEVFKAGNPPPKPKRKVSSYHKRLGREIKRLMKAHKTKAGKWKKGWSQKRLMKTAHKNTK